MSAKRRVAYYYQGDIGHYYYGPGHPMKPQRLKLTHHLILAYGLYRKLEVYRPHAASPEELSRFHSDDYIDFLRRVTPEKAREYGAALSKYNIGEFTDCPVFDGLFSFCSSYSGASIDGALRLNHGLTDIAINWAGGLHHAKKQEASGFCYINDIVLAILELLKYHQRVLYIDIDVHHGDGVEEAFYTSDRVMTVSFHKFGDFFPGTGSVKDVGTKTGKYYSVNFPLQDGIDDLSYEHCFKPVIDKIMQVFRPGAVVLQCGADSLTSDRLGCFNLTIKGHSECVRYVKSFGLPTMVLGGGGYTIRNVARCWANETATLLDEVLPDFIPPNDYIEYYRPDYRLHLEPAAMDNLNSREYLEKCKSIILENLRYLDAAPSVQFQYVPPDFVVREAEEEARHASSAGADLRPGDFAEGRRELDGEFYDNDHDVDAMPDEERERAVDRERRRKVAGDVDTGLTDQLLSVPADLPSAAADISAHAEATVRPETGAVVVKAEATSAAGDEAAALAAASEVAMEALQEVAPAPTVVESAEVEDEAPTSNQAHSEFQPKADALLHTPAPEEEAQPQ